MGEDSDATQEVMMDVDETPGERTKEGSDKVADTNGLSGNKSAGDNSEDSDSGSEEEAIAIEPLATTRSRRSNAGNRMSTLILEEEDEFYTQNYGGFQEEEDDNDFDEEEEVDDEEIEEDYDVDSDFDIDETDEIAPEYQAVDEEPRRRKAAFREPQRKVQQGMTTGNILNNAAVQTPKTPRPSSSATPQSPNKHRPERTFRDSTKKKAAETIKNIESVKKRRKYRSTEPQRKLTQEEMLEEAKLTEEENIKSLEIYQRLESEKLKKIKMIKKSIPAPYITYYSSVFKNPETEERYSRNMCTFVGCEPQSMSAKTAITSRK